MSLPELADLARLTISGPQGPAPTDGLWTSRSPVLLPLSPIPGQQKRYTSIPSPVPIFPRYEFGFCTNESGDVYIHGGSTSANGRTAELYHYSMKDNTVTLIQYCGTSPGRRDGHAMALVGNVIAVHGGWTGDNDPHLFLLDLGSHEWSRITAFGDAPGNLREHAMAAIDTTIYVFGGYDGSTHANSDKLWAFDLSTLPTAEPTWELVKPSSQAKPSARYGITLLPYRGQLIMCGGNNKRDVWSFDPKTREWSQLRCTGHVPPPRVGHTAAIFNNAMYIIGGSRYISSLEGDELKDIFALKMPEQRWFKLRNTDAAPVPRYYHASACMGTKIFIFGGNFNGASEEHSIHILDINYIDNTDLHAPERLKEADIECQVTGGREKSGNDLKETETSKRGEIILHVLEYPQKTELLAQLHRADAQMIVDLLADELESQDILQSNTDKRRILHFLTKLAKSTQIFPKCTELSDVQCNLTNPVNDEGAYGFIYKGTFRDQEVCVKAVRIIGSGTKAAKILRAQAGETVLLAHVSHPNVIPLYGTYFSREQTPRICIVSPWMENGDLVAYLRNFPNTPKIPLASDMAAGLAFLHDMGIIHADLKARNVLVSRSRRAMLADFGIATVLHTNVGMSTAGDYAGTTWWMAPELLIAIAKNQPPPPTKESDMWGFACICYEMFIDGIPFVNRYIPIQLMMAFMNGRRITPLRPNEESSPINADDEPIDVDGEPWVPLAERCWNFDPNERATAAEALQFLKELKVRDDRPSMDEELAKFKAIKDSRAKVEIDYTHVLSIVRNN